MPDAPLVMEEFAPPPAALVGVVRHLLLLHTPPTATPATRTLLPNFQLVLLLNLGPAADLWLPGYPSQLLHRVLLAGPLTTALRYRLPPGARVLAITLTLSGFTQLFGIPAQCLPSLLADPDLLLTAARSPFARLRERLLALDTLAAMARVVEAALGPLVQQLAAPQAELLGTLPLLALPGPGGSLKAMAAASRLSPRTLQARFRQYLGFSAREASRFLRFRRLLAEVRQQPRAEWQALLERHGYYDQSHLIHDFGHFLRLPPRQAAAQLQNGEDICFTASDLLQ